MPRHKFQLDHAGYCRCGLAENHPQHDHIIGLTREEAETVIHGLSSGASDHVRYQAWEILDTKIKEGT